MIKHDKKLKASFKHFRKTGDTEPMTRLLIQKAIYSTENMSKSIRTVI